MPNKCIYRNII